MQRTLSQLKGQVFNHSVLVSQLEGYARPNDKISDMISKAELVPLKRGLYALGTSDGRPLSKGLIANHLYGPSYVSGYWMLAHYGWLTERVETVTSMCMERSRQIDTPLGRFSYAAIPTQYYASGLTSIQEGGIAFRLFRISRDHPQDVVSSNDTSFTRSPDVSQLPNSSGHPRC